MADVKDCLAGHEGHNTIVTKHNFGVLEVYNVDEYKDVKRYCPGKNEQSQLVLNGDYSEAFTALQSILARNNKKKKRLVIDFGGEVGLYPIMAANMNYDVCAFEEVPDNIMLIERSAELNKVVPQIFVEPTPISKSTPQATIGGFYINIALMRINLPPVQGKQAFRVMDNLIKDKKVSNILIESDVNKYKKQINNCIDIGYKVHEYGESIILSLK
jgi:hypothetical protein